jgi:uncharacterized membrane protein YkoI
MTRNTKIGAAVVMFVLGIVLIAWNMRDPDAAYREPKKVEKVLTAGQLPGPVQETLKRVASQGKVTAVQEESRGDKLHYEVKVVSGNTQTKYEIAPDGSVITQKSKQLKPQTAQ